MDGLVINLDTFEIVKDVSEEIIQEAAEKTSSAPLGLEDTKLRFLHEKSDEEQMSIFDFLPLENSS